MENSGGDGSEKGQNGTGPLEEFFNNFRFDENFSVFFVGRFFEIVLKEH